MIKIWIVLNQGIKFKFNHDLKQELRLMLEQQLRFKQRLMVRLGFILGFIQEAKFNLINTLTTAWLLLIG
jgi:hypothetical protein